MSSFFDALAYFGGIAFALFVLIPLLIALIVFAVQGFKFDED